MLQYGQWAEEANKLKRQIRLGSCLCGQVKFKTEGNLASFYLCHCKYCQKDTGSAHTANIFVPDGSLIWISGEEKVKTFNFPSTRHIKSFCTECGSALPNLQMEGKLLVIPAGSLDSILAAKPDAHIFFSSKATWDSELENIKKFEKIPI